MYCASQQSGNRIYAWPERGAEKLWKKLNSQSYVAALGALTGNQAVQEVAAGLEAIYLSGWQVAADANSVQERCILISHCILLTQYLM